MMIAAALAVIATPALAQTTPGNVDPAGTTAPADPAGGYAPTMPVRSGSTDPNAVVTVVPSTDPSVAFPPPAPMASYPICKKGQTDGCMDPPGAKSTVYKK